MHKSLDQYGKSHLHWIRSGLRIYRLLFIQVCLPLSSVLSRPPCVNMCFFSSSTVSSFDAEAAPLNNKQINFIFAHVVQFWHVYVI